MATQGRRIAEWPIGTILELVSPDPTKLPSYFTDFYGALHEPRRRCTIT